MRLVALYPALAVTLLSRCVLVPPALGAQSTIASVRSTNTPLHLAEDVVRALALAHLGAVPAETAGLQTESAMGVAIFYSLKQQRAALEDAIVVVGPYSHDPDSTISKAGHNLVLGFGGLHLFADSTATLLRLQLDNPGATTVGDHAERIAGLMDLRRRSAMTLLLGVSAVTNALVTSAAEPITSGTSKAHLGITQRERAKLTNQIQRTFGSALEPKNGQYGSDYAGAAVLLRDFLRQSWRTRR